MTLLLTPLKAFEHLAFEAYRRGDMRRIIDVGISAQSKKNQINLAMRALYDLWNTAPEGDKAQYEELGYDGLSEAYQFFIGRSYDDYRPLNGKIAEARVWSVARTLEQIWENMYEIENPENDSTLLGYWKFNEGSGNTVKDYSMYGNDGVAKYDIIWPQGIEIPKLNENNEYPFRKDLSYDLSILNRR